MFKPPLDPDEATSDSDVVENILLRKAEEGRDIGSNLRRIVRIIDMIWINKQRFRHAADGKFLAVSVENRTAQGLNAVLVAALIPHPLREGIPLHHLQIGIAKGQYNENDKHPEGNIPNPPLHRRTNIFHRIALPHIVFQMSSYHKYT